MVFLTTFIILFGFWIFLSGMFDLFHLSLGIISCALVSLISGNLLFSEKRVKRNHLIQIFRFIRYLPWLLYQIILANLHVAFLVLHPKMSSRIDPHIIRFKMKLKSDLSLTTFANSITLTPGTITVLIHEGYFYVHSINQKVADDLLTGEMEERVARIYQEE
jgi:multicomponent Na+:H+ antiporter subunit E